MRTECTYNYSLIGLLGCVVYRNVEILMFVSKQLPLEQHPSGYHSGFVYVLFFLLLLFC